MPATANIMKITFSQLRAFKNLSLLRSKLLSKSICYGFKNVVLAINGFLAELAGILCQLVLLLVQSLFVGNPFFGNNLYAVVDAALELLLLAYSKQLYVYMSVCGLGYNGVVEYRAVKR